MLGPDQRAPIRVSPDDLPLIGRSCAVVLHTASLRELEAAVNGGEKMHRSWSAPLGPDR
jgi:hypothetical protein